jgi:hypothetical protein
MAESKSADANYSQRSDIVLQDDTTFVKDTSGALHVSATAFSQHVAKQDAEELAKEARAALSYMGNVTGADAKRGKK